MNQSQTENTHTCDEDVFRLDIMMYDILGMQCVDGGCDFPKQSKDDVTRENLLLNKLQAIHQTGLCDDHQPTEVWVVLVGYGRYTIHPQCCLDDGILGKTRKYRISSIIYKLWQD